MTPALKPGDLIKVEEVPARRFSEGDIVVFPTQRGLLCHRLVRLFKENGRVWAVTQGDRSSTEDPSVPADRIIGRMAQIERPRVWHQFIWRSRLMAQRLLRWRLGLAKGMFLAARAIEFFALGIVRSKDLLETNRRFYTDQTRVAWMNKEIRVDLFPQEAQLLERLSLNAGRALILGCGAGRESIALAKRGWTVVGVDASDSLIQAASRKAAQEAVAIDWVCHDITQSLPVEGSFDLVCLFNIFYSLIPGRSNRLNILKSCKERLKPTGIYLVSFMKTGGGRSRKVRWAHLLRKGLAWCLRGYLECQLGDHWERGGFFVHDFSAGEFEEEAAQAGFLVSYREGDGIRYAPAVLRLASQSSAAMDLASDRVAGQALGR